MSVKLCLWVVKKGWTTYTVLYIASLASNLACVRYGKTRKFVRARCGEKDCWSGTGGASKHNFKQHVSNRLKLIYSESWRQELLIGEYMRPIGGGGVVRGGPEFFGPPLQKFTGSLLQKFQYINEILGSSPVNWHPFWANWVKEGVCGHVQKSEAHGLGCRPRGESSQ